eukprot:492787_1
MAALFVFILSLFVASWSYKMGPDTITCWEQNKQDPTGFTDEIWGNPDCESLHDPALCQAYTNPSWDLPYRGKGDVCETDNRNNPPLPQDMCYFNVIFGTSINAEKTWSYKCWHSQLCPLKDANGNGIPGCLITGARITCCCNDEDYCNGQALFQKYAEWGNPELHSFPPDVTEILNLDAAAHGVNVEFSPIASSGGGGRRKPP